MFMLGIKRKSILNESKIEYTDYGCNFYKGCAHGCTYPCYARTMSKMPYYTWLQPSFVSNVLDILQKEVKRKTPGKVMVSTMTDPYQPIENRYRLTPRVAKLLLKNGFYVIIQTKSIGVLADVDLYKAYPKQSTVRFTLITSDDVVRQTIEPFASPISARVETIKILHDLGVHTGISAEPLLPFTKYEVIDDLLALHPWVDEYLFGTLSHAARNPVTGEPYDKKEVHDYYLDLKMYLDDKVDELSLNAYFKQKISAFPEE